MIRPATATVTRLRLHPIKGLPPAGVAEARVLPSGALAFDRRWALVDGARCVVPSRDARTGEITTGFQKRFVELRLAQFPAGASTALVDHYYRFVVNTRIAASETDKVIRLGDLCQPM